MSAHDKSTNRPRQGRARLTDSPWFWLLVFANAALLGVAVIGPKYNVRQAAVERRYEARREIARRASGETASNETAPDENSSGDTSAHIVPLLPLALVLVVGNLVAIVLFVSSKVRLIKSRAENSHPRGP